MLPHPQGVEFDLVWVLAVLTPRCWAELDGADQDGLAPSPRRAGDVVVFHGHLLLGEPLPLRLGGVPVRSLPEDGSGLCEVCCAVVQRLERALCPEQAREEVCA